MLTTTTNTTTGTEQVAPRRIRLPVVVGYEPPIQTCAFPGCDMPTSGVFCLSCATR